VLLPLAVLAAVAVTGLGPALGWLASPWIVGLACAAALLGFACARAYRGTAAPALDLGLLRDRNVAVAIAITFALNLTSTGLFETEYLGQVAGRSTTSLGLRGTLGGLAMLLGLALGGQLLAGGRRARATLYLGFAAMIAGKAGFTFYAAHTSVIMADWTNAVTAFAFGLMTTALATLAYRTIPAARADAVAALFVLAAYLGAALGASVLDEVVVAPRSLLDRRESDALALDRAFHVEFWVELALFVPLVLLPGRFAEAAAERRPPASGTGGGRG
jgi:hypothetical protein